MNNEVWKDIKGYEGFYQVSNLGRVKSNYNKKDNELTIKKTYVNDHGYEIVNLYNHISKKGYKCRVHRLVAEAFNKNEHGYNVVNHIDGNKLNNNSNNLEYCSVSDNVKHAYDIGLRKTKSIIQFDKQNNIIKKWFNATDIEKTLNIWHSNVIKCCLGKRKTAGGYVWKYESEVMPIYEQNIDKQ